MRLVDRKVIGKVIRDLRTKKGLSQADLSVCMNNNQQNISAYENGDRAPGIEWVLRFCQCVGVSFTEFAQEYDHSGE